MNKLLYIDDKGELKITEYGLAIREFSDIWNRDKSENRGKAIKDISFCWFCISMSSNNPYREYNRKERIERVMDAVYGGAIDYASDALLVKAVERMREFDKSLAKDFLRTTINSLYKEKEFLSGANLDERDGNGKLIHNIKQYNDLVKGMADTLKSLSELTKMIENDELNYQSKIRGDGRREFDL